MMPIPSRRLVIAATVLAVSSLALLVFPWAWMVLIALDILLFLAAVLDWALTPSPQMLEASRVVAERLSVLNDHPVAMLVRNRSAVPLWVRVRDSVPVTMTTATEELAGKIPAAAEVRWEYVIRPTRRGLFSWGPLQLRYLSMLGLWELSKTIDAAQEVRRLSQSDIALSLPLAGPGESSRGDGHSPSEAAWGRLGIRILAQVCARR